MPEAADKFEEYLRENFSFDGNDLASLGNIFRQLLVAEEADASAPEKLLKIRSFWRQGNEALPERVGSKERPNPGVLKAAGYYVSGLTIAIPQHERRAVLLYVMTEDDLPPIKDKAHMREWGTARSITRFAKLESVLKNLESDSAGDPLRETSRFKWAEDYAFVIAHADGLLSPAARKRKADLIAWFKGQQG